MLHEADADAVGEAVAQQAVAQGVGAAEDIAERWRGPIRAPTSFQMRVGLPLPREIQATTPSRMSLETQSIASGRRARKRRKNDARERPAAGWFPRPCRSRGRTLRSEARRSRQVSSTAAWRLCGMVNQRASVHRTVSGRVCRKIEMLTPKGEHFFPLFYQGDVRWENQSRRNRNRQNFVVGSYFLTGLQSRENPARRFFVRNLLFWADLREEVFDGKNGKAGQKLHFSPEEIALISTKSVLCRFAPQLLRCSVVSASASSPRFPRLPEGTQTAEKKPGNEREREQYPDESKRVYDQVTDVVPLGGNPLVQGHNGLVFDQSEQRSRPRPDLGDLTPPPRGGRCA